MNRQCFGLLVSFALATLLGLTMVSSQSFWIDEGQSLKHASYPTFSAWLHEIRTTPTSEAQMPGGMFVEWLSGKILGTREWQLRAVNVLWIGLAGVAFALIERTCRSKIFFTLALMSPFLWFYADEARPYALLVCLGAWLLYFLLRLETEIELKLLTLSGISLVSVVGFATHALFAFVILGCVVAAMPRLWRMRNELRTQHFVVVACAACLLLLIAIYYGTTVKRGASGAKLWNVGIQNAAFSFYELLGFGGLGPSRHNLRDLARGGGSISAALLDPAYLGVLALMTLYTSIAIFAGRGWRDHILIRAIVVIVCASAALFIAAELAHFPFWGRHLAGILPFATFAVSRLVAENPRPRLRIIIFSLLFACYTFSALRQRFATDYRKDDYRYASSIAIAANNSGFKVWWVADAFLGQHYGIQPRNETNGVNVFVETTEKNINLQKSPDLVILSKPDIYDPTRAVTDFVLTRPYVLERRVPGFAFWVRSGSSVTNALPRK